MLETQSADTVESRAILKAQQGSLASVKIIQDSKKKALPGKNSLHGRVPRLKNIPSIQAPLSKNNLYDVNDIFEVVYPIISDINQTQPWKKEHHTYRQIGWWQRDGPGLVCCLQTLMTFSVDGDISSINLLKMMEDNVLPSVSEFELKSMRFRAIIATRRKAKIELFDLPSTILGLNNFENLWYDFKLYFHA